MFKAVSDYTVCSFVRWKAETSLTVHLNGVDHAQGNPSRVINDCILAMAGSALPGGQQMTKSRVKEWLSGVRQGLSVAAGFPMRSASLALP